jgi:FkbM family methyltransferase
MYLLKEKSEKSENPYFIEIEKNKNNESNLLLFFPEISVAQWFYRDGIPERNVINTILNNYINENNVFIDIGAHVGTYSMIIGKKAKHTYAFECNPKVFCYLAANIALHNLENKVTPHRFALGNTEKEIEYFYRSEDGGGNGVKKLYGNEDKLNKSVVDMKKLDSFNIKNVGAIKIDVEGFEKEVIEGSLLTIISNNYPVLIFESWGDWKLREVSDASNLRNELMTFVKSLGYTIEEIGFDMYIAKKL